MKIEKAQINDQNIKQGKDKIIFSFSDYKILVIFFLFLIAVGMEIYYRFQLYGDQGTDNLLGPTLIACITLLCMWVINQRNKNYKSRVLRKKFSISDKQSVSFDDNGIELNTGELMKTKYIWFVVDKIDLTKKNLVFYFPNGSFLYVRRFMFSDEEINDIIEMWKNNKTRTMQVENTP